jgi:hypothetical protein
MYSELIVTYLLVNMCSDYHHNMHNCIILYLPYLLHPCTNYSCLHAHDVMHTMASYLS